VIDFCLKLCRFDFKVGDMFPDNVKIKISQTIAASRVNKQFKRYGENEFTKLIDCQHPNVVQVYLIGFTDKGNIVILIERAKCDFWSYY